ncbi:ThiF family adenylyltransferase [Psychromonas hadalis]|uniref:ThiF family adenylyltransferase n=1 Tax=Psychromonas hadalis TaxID=211669 RepID=UPI0003B3C850|nr:ThiF family adenylyltransferase [Psychromonas hadalis]
MVHDIDLIVEFLKKNGFNVVIRDNELISTHSCLTASFSIRIEFPDEFPYVLPNYHLENRGDFGHLAHVAWGAERYASICIGSQESFSINFDAPEKVVFDTLKMAEKIVQNSLDNPEYNYQEILKEFGGVWRFHVASDAPRILNFINNLNHFSPLIVRSKFTKDVQNGLGNVIIASENNPCQGGYAVNISASSRFRQNIGKGIYLPIPTDMRLMPPLPYQDIMEWWCGVLNLIDNKTKIDLKEYARLKKATACYVVLGVFTQDQVATVALEFKAEKKSKLPFHESFIGNWNATAINADDFSPSSLIQRGGGAIDINQKNVCIIGCGSVGGYIAHSLASSGVGKLTLVDYDNYNPENIHRHILPSRYLYTNKASSLSDYLTENFPFVIAKPLNTQLLELSPYELKDYDLVIVATGNVSQERVFNREIAKEGLNIPVIYSWQEAYGVGGHSVLSTPFLGGCLECTYIGLASDEVELFSNLNFIASGQKVLKGHAGCGTEFLPYSSIDARDTASLTCRLAIKVLTKTVTHGVSGSWRQDSEEAKENNIELTHRYTHLQHVEKLKEIKSTRCPCCAK